MIWTDLSKNLHDPVGHWAEDLREAFVRRFDAFWSDPASKDAFDNADTERVCRLGNQAEEDAFKTAEAQGCCESKIRGAEDAVMLAAEEVWKYQVGAGWEAEQQRLAVHRLVRAYGELNRLRSDAAAHDAKRPSGIRKV